MRLRPYNSNPLGHVILLEKEIAELEVGSCALPRADNGHG